MKTYGVTIADHGSAIVTVERDAEEQLLVTGIARLAFDLDVVADRVLALDAEDPEARFTIDGAGLGSALWAALGPPQDDRWQLYGGRGLERQQLVDRLLVAIHAGTFHFAAGLPEQEAMSKAMSAYRREVKEDGYVGSELITALLVAIIPPPVPKVPLVAWI